MIERLKIRMYDMGFGDCFLVTFLSSLSAKHVLFDCGSLSRPKAEVARVAKDIVAACTPTGGRPRLELVVCTHRHKDHVCGFDDAIWAGVEVGEVWMPWTEDPNDDVATRIRTGQSGFAQALCMAIDPAYSPDAMPLADARPRARNAAREARDARLALALNALTNEKAMATLHRGFLGNPPRFFLPTKERWAESRTLATLPGIRFRILGPSRDPEVIKTMNPPRGTAYFGVRGADPAAVGQDGACEATWRIDMDTFREQRRDKGNDGPDPVFHTTFNGDDRKAVDNRADDPTGEFAAAIDNAVNNTSLMIMIEVGDQHLLFPGDAQWGTWNAVLEDAELRALLARTTVLKVSHHGSHNGTPKALLEEVFGAGVTAFVSTVPTGQVKQWPDIPRPPLIAALSGKTTLVRSDDETSVAGKDGFNVKSDLYIEWETAVGADGGALSANH